MQSRAFRFEPLLEARRREETRAQAKYAGCRAASNAARRDSEEALRLLDDARVRAFAIAECSSLREWQAYIDVLARRSVVARQLAAVPEATAEAAREEVVRASRACAVLELLRDRQRAATMRALAAAEERERDDFTAWQRSAASA